MWVDGEPKAISEWQTKGATALLRLSPTTNAERQKVVDSWKKGKSDWPFVNFLEKKGANGKRHNTHWQFVANHKQLG